MNIAVYCSARTDIRPIHTADAQALGQWIGQNHHTLVYGGLDLGLMGVVATHTRAAGGQVVGVVPAKKAHLAHPANHQTIPVTTLHQRKAEMEARADAFVALAGGYGTLDEVLSALATMSFFNRPKPIIMIGRDSLYAPLADMLGRMVDEGLVYPEVASRLHIVQTPEEAIQILNQTQHNT